MGVSDIMSQNSKCYRLLEWERVDDLWPLIQRKTVVIQAVFD